MPNPPADVLIVGAAPVFLPTEDEVPATTNVAMKFYIGYRGQSASVEKVLGFYSTVFVFVNHG